MIDINNEGEVVQIKMSAEMGGKPLYWVAAYLVDGILIDTGCMRTAGEFTKYLEGKNIDLILNTHHHEDHVGANNILAQKLGVTIMAHPEEVPLINRVPELNPYQELVWGCPEPSVALPITKSIETGRLHFDVVHTPGHCAGHIALVEPNRGWCFSGDLFVSENQKVFRADEDINTIIDSAKKLLQLGVPGMKLFTSIGRICDDGIKALENFVEYMEDIREKSLDLYSKGCSHTEIRDSVFGRESSLRDLTGGHYSIENLVRSLVGT